MVDAINAINSATRSVAQERKDLTIDWYKLTANQVIEYANQGEDVPPDILRWAEDYAKLTNVPDDVTYESVNGSVEAEDARNTEESTETEEEITTDESIEEDTDESETEPQEISLYERTGTLIQESNTVKGQADEVSSDTSSKINQTLEVKKRAEQQVKNTETKARPIKAEYDELLNKLNGDKSKITPEDLLKLDKLVGQLNGIGRNAQSNLTMYDAQIEEIERVFAQYGNVPPLAKDKGTETVDAGEELFSQAAGFLHLTRASIRGLEAINMGSLAIDAGDNADILLDNGQKFAAETSTNIIEAMRQVENMTFVKGNKANSTAENESAEENKNTEAITEEPEENTEETETKTQNGVVKDSALLTDAEELKRRKINRGEIQPDEQA